MGEVERHIEAAEKAVKRASGNTDQAAALTSIAHMLLAFWHQKYEYRLDVE